MKGISSILRYFFTCQRLNYWIFILGVILTIVTIFLSVFKPFDISLDALVLVSFIATFAFTYLTSPATFRALIANRQLSLVPNFQIKAGIALFLLTVITSCYLSLFAKLNGTIVVTPLLPLLFFSIGSLYSGFSQITISISNKVLQGSFHLLPVVIYFFIIFNSDLFYFLIQDPKFTLTLSTFCLAGWLRGFHILLTQNNYKSLPASFKQNEWSQTSTSNTENFWFKPDRFNSPAYVLLTGFSDTLKDRLKRKMILLLAIPIAAAIALIILGQLLPAAENPPPIIFIFLAISFMSATLPAIASGEFSAHARRTWLRQGSDRQRLWRDIEKIVLSDLLLTILITVPICITSVLISEVSISVMMVYLILLVSFSAFNSYMALASRIMNWPRFLALPLLIIIIVLIIASAFMAAAEDSMHPITIGIQGSIILFIIIFRYLAKRGFNKIDWQKVKPAIINRHELAHEGLE